MGNLFHLETLFPALDDIVQVETDYDYEENLFQAEKWKKKHAEMLTLHQQGTFFPFLSFLKLPHTAVSH